jgi:hypothetical protein
VSGQHVSLNLCFGMRKRINISLSLSLSLTTGKRGAVVHPDSAVHHRTAKRALPCDTPETHGKEYKHGK